MATVKETKEFLNGLMDLSLFLAERMKDGVGMDDALAVYTKITTDPEFKQKIEAAYENAKIIPEELKDIDIYEGIDLTKMILDFIPKFLETLKPVEPVA